MALSVCSLRAAAVRVAATRVVAARQPAWAATLQPLARWSSTQPAAADAGPSAKLTGPGYVPKRELAQALTDYLAALATPDQLPALEATLQAAHRKGLKGRPDTSLAVLSACLRVGGEEGLQALGQVFSHPHPSLPVDGTVLRRLVGALVNRSRPDLAWLVFAARGPAVQAGLGVHKRLLATGATSGEMYGQALELYRTMCTAGPFPDQEAYHVMAQAATAQGDRQTAEAVLRQCQQAGFALPAQ